MALQAGSAYSDYRLRLDGFYADVRAAESALRDFQSKAESIKPPALGGDGAGARAAAELAKANAQIAQAQARATAAQEAAEQAALRTAQAHQRLAQAQAAAATAAQRLATEEARTAAAQSSAAKAATQAEAAQERLNAARERGNSGNARGGSLAESFKGSLLEVAGSFGVVTSGAAAATLAVSGLINAFNARAALVGTQQQFTTLVGSVELANQKIEEATAFADRYNIKQSEVNAALAAAAPIIKTSTAATEDQLSALTRLASLNPGEGIEGAVFALRELTAASTAGEGILSLVERFNLSKDVATELFNTIKGGEDVFVALDATLNQVGATEELLANRTQGVVGAQNAASKATEDFQLALGRLVEGPGAKLLTLYAQLADGGTTLVNKLAGQSNAFDQQAAVLALTSQSYDQYRATLDTASSSTGLFIAQNQGLFTALNSIIPGFSTLATSAAGLAVQNTALSQSEFAFAQALTATGVAQDAAVAKAQAQSTALGTIETVLLTNQAALGEYEGQLYSVAAAYDDGATRVANLLTAYANEQITIEQLRVALANLEVSARVEADAKAAATAATEEKAAADAAATAEAEAAAAASQAYTDAISLENSTLAENLGQKLENELQTQRLSQAQGELASLGSAVASGLLTAAQAAAQLAAKYNIASAEAARLIQLQATLARSQAVAAAGFSGVPEGYLGAAIGGRPGSSGTGLGPTNSVLTRIAAEGEAATKRYEAAVRDYEAAERRAAKGGAGGGGGTGKGRGKGGPSQAEKQAQREAERLAEQQQRINEQRVAAARETEERLLNLQRETAEKRLQIQLDYNRRQLEAEDNLRVESLNSRASFYDALTQATPDIGQEQAQSLSAAYEQAFAEAQRLAQEGKAEMAARYLELKQEQIQAELDFQQKVAAAREKGDQAEVDRLEKIRALYRQEEEERLKQLLEGGDKNVEARDEALAAESERYRESKDKILDASAEKAEKLAADEAKIYEAAVKTNSAYAEQLRLQQQLAGKSPAAPATTTPAATAPPPTAPTLPETQARAQQAAALPAAATEGGVVLVSDAALLAAVQQLSSIAQTLVSVAGRGVGAAEATGAGLADVAAETRRVAEKVGRLGGGRGLAS